MSFEPGSYVRHPGQPGWGNGLVLELVAPGKLRVRFSNAGEKVLLLSFAPLEPAHPPPSEEVSLAGPAPRARRSPPQVTPHDKLVAEFLWRFPGGFRSSAYDADERGRKVKAHESAVVELSEPRLRAAIESGRFDDVVKGTLKVLSATDLVPAVEQTALRDALAKPRAREPFSRRLYSLLHGEGPFQPRFEAFTGFLLEAGAASWAVATYFPFIVHPKEHMFLRPDVILRAAQAYGFRLDYDSRPGWPTYERLLVFARQLEESLGPLQPADRLDVQAFLWVVGVEGRSR